MGVAAEMMVRYSLSLDMNHVVVGYVVCIHCPNLSKRFNGFNDARRSATLPRVGVRCPKNPRNRINYLIIGGGVGLVICFDNVLKCIAIPSGYW